MIYAQCDDYMRAHRGLYTVKISYAHSQSFMLDERILCVLTPSYA